MNKEAIIFKRLLGSLVWGVFIAQTCWATPTGLNNIPTADVVPEKTLVFQGIVDVGKDNKPDWFIGFKYGLMKNLEVGLDGRIFPESALEETLKGQIKYRIPLSDQTAMALGVANLGDRAKLGWEDYYMAATHDLGFLRAHLGGTLQRDNEGVFAGLDKTFQFLDRDFTLRTDVIQTNDAHDTTTSVGFIYGLTKNILLESWISFPTQSGREDVSTIKFDYVIEF